MKVAIVLATLAVASATDLGAWYAWKRDNGRAYTDDEDVVRFSNFKKNLATIASLNEVHRKGTARFGPNKFADWSDAELKSLRGTRVPSNARDGIPEVAQVQVATNGTVDWRKKGVVSPVQNQQQCGSCWAFSATANIESRWAIAKGATPPPKLAEQALVDCDKECGTYHGEQGCDAGCEGGLMMNAFKYVIANGQPKESAYPYMAADGRCKAVPASPVNISSWDLLPQDETKIAAYLEQNGPVSIAVAASMWSFYMGGIMEYLCPGKTTLADLDHGVDLVGYGSEDGTDYWIVRNSWGPSWGEEGYCRILRGVGFCGVQLMACSSVV
eukprot:TRINITY_DN240_c0_g2_i1.p2 TRINITY_DN240_c0_g2~~TRINITY_DN240_c0_g2_i1.p2  ORF type:complete len:338 (+),score=68.53 TRINITY_DN240_c0_g2_i1:31-1014(+)